MSWQGREEGLVKVNERRVPKRSSSEANITDVNRDQDIGCPSKLQKEAETPIAQATQSNVDNPDHVDVTEPPELTEAEYIYMQTKTLLSQLSEKKERDLAFLSEMETEINTKVAQMIKCMKDEAVRRCESDIVEGLVSDIAKTLQHIDELAQKRRQFREALTSALSFTDE